MAMNWIKVVTTLLLVSCHLCAPSISGSISLQDSIPGMLKDVCETSYYPTGTHVDDWQQQSSHKLKTGTTIVGICCKGGVVLGADSRTTGGPLVMDKDKVKIHRISHRIYSCAAGTSADCTQVIRRANHLLALKRIERELEGACSLLDLVAASVSCVVEELSSTTGAGRKKEAAFVLGGVDCHGPSLFQIGLNGMPEKLSFAAMGSGSTDAMAILESFISKWQAHNNVPGDGSLPSVTCLEEVDIEDATKAVRMAVRAGIVNDMGSGSHVDLCVITTEDVRLWRERLLSDWDAYRLTIEDILIEGAGNERVSSGSDDTYASGGNGGDPKDSTTVIGSILSKQSLGTRLYSTGSYKRQPELRSLAGDLTMDIELIE